MAVKDVRPVHCQHLMNDLEGMSTDLAKKVRNLLYNLFRSAVENNMRRDNPAIRLTLPLTATPCTHRAITARERTILLETTKDLLRGAKTRMLGVWVLLLLYTGMRPGESVALTGSDIRGGYIHVSKALDRMTRGTKLPKSKAGVRKIPIIPALEAVLPQCAPGEPIFLNRNNNSWDNKTIARQWKTVLAAMSVAEAKLVADRKISAFKEAAPPLVPYDLRHTYCSNLERAGVPINVARELMGHSDISIIIQSMLLQINQRFC